MRSITLLREGFGLLMVGFSVECTFDASVNNILIDISDALCPVPEFPLSPSDYPDDDEYEEVMARV